MTNLRYKWAPFLMYGQKLEYKRTPPSIDRANRETVFTTWIAAV